MVNKLLAVLAILFILYHLFGVGSDIIEGYFPYWRRRLLPWWRRPYGNRFRHYGNRHYGNRPYWYRYNYYPYYAQY